MDDTFLTFMDEPDSIDHCRENRPWKIMVVDDEKSIHDITTLSLKEFTFDGQGVEFINAYSAQQARAYLQATPDIALMLVDVVMESENAGLEFVRYVRNELKNSIVQVVIRTGQPGYAPEDRVISDYQINSYFSKTEVTSQKLVSLVTTSLRTYQLSLALQQALAKGKKAESDLRELNQDLEKRIEERTKQVSRANQLKSQFLANMSHEIRTPMNGIIGMANLLLDEPLTLKQKKVAGIIRSSGNTLLALINDILDLSKIEAGQLVFELKDFELNALVHEALALFKIKADQKGLKLIAHIDPALPSCLAGDPVRLKQILVNLLGNAVKFTSKGRVDLGVCLAKEFKAHILMNIEVKDTGPGIDKAFKARMFDTFSQADASTTRKYGGTGLGLAITRQLANMMDGHVDAWNRPGGGAVFKVGLKLKKYSGVPSLKDDDPFSKEAQSVLLEQIGKMDINILVAEDNPTNQKVISLILEKMNLFPDMVAHGQAVLGKMAKKSYDVLIMDVQMPVLDGLETTRIIRDKHSLVKQKNIQIIALTAMAMDEDAKACKQAGMDQYLTKPIHPQKLLLAIARALGL